MYLDVHPRVAMQIFRHAQFSLTMEIYTLASPKATRDALKRLGESLVGNPQLYFAAVRTGKAPSDLLGQGL